VDSGRDFDQHIERLIRSIEPILARRAKELEEVTQRVEEEPQRAKAVRQAEEEKQRAEAARQAEEEKQRAEAAQQAEEQQRIAAQKAAEKQQRAGGVAAYNRRDYSTALLTLEPLAQAGDAVAQCYIGVMYLNGQGVPEKPDLALEWLSKAAPTLQPLAQAGDGPAQYCLGVMYLKGKGVPEKPELALEWLSKAASAGFSDAQSYMGSFNRRAT
jgi:uncharacterized protein